jgi:YHS domain-containing protein
MHSRFALCLQTAGTLLVAASLPALALGQTSGVAWRTDYEQAKVEAAQTGRLVLIHFTTKKCAPCKTLDKTVFSQPQVGPAIEQDFVPIRVDADDNQALAMNFRIDRVPTEIIMTPEGKVLANPPIPDQPGPYLAQLQNIARHFREAPPAVAQPSPPANVNNAYANLPMANARQMAQASPQVAPSQPQVAAQPAAAPASQSQPNPYAAAPPQATANPYASAPPAATTPGRYGSANNVYAATPSQQQPAAQPQVQMSQSAASPAPKIAVANAPAMPNNAMPRSFQGADSGVAASAVAAAAPVVGASVAAGGGTPATGASPSVGATAGIAGAAAATVAAAEPARRQAPQLPAGSPPLAFDGNCPVTLKNLNHWTMGDAQYGAVHRGRTYLFAGAEQRDQFLANPDSYSPVFAGLDPVLLIDKQQSVEGKRSLGWRYGESFYLFSSEETKQKFKESPHVYAAGVRQAMSRIDAGDTVRR